MGTAIAEFGYFTHRPEDHRSEDFCAKPQRGGKFYFGARRKISYPSRFATVSDEEPYSLEEKFERLSKEWKKTNGLQSSISRIVTHPAYLEIISEGEKMIPFILKDLKKAPNHWFVALKIINNQFSPVKPEDAGNIKKMTEAWLEWGRKNGKLG